MSNNSQQGSEYKILKVIGKGAFGDAYLGIHQKQKKQYVIKQVDIKNKSKQQKQHIFHEVKLLQQFNHINIVQYRDSYIDKKGLLNIVMEYCDGGDMNQVIQNSQGTKIAQDKLLFWLGQMALAIFYLHDKKILHRDLKSPNIFILKGEIRLGDFGISKVLDHVRDLAQTNIGTPYYMSPEQYNHKPYSYKSDIWAFGCILYEMCNQRRPFQANNLQALGMKVVRGNFPPVSECYSKQLRGLIGQMLLKNPTKRPNIIEILQKPFIKKKVIDYMKIAYMKKQSLSKQIISSLKDQAKKLCINLQEKPNMDKKPVSTTRQSTQSKERSTSAKKRQSKTSLDQHQKIKLQREKKKQQLERQLNKHNEQRKQMALKLKKIQEQRKSVLAKKTSHNNIRQVYQKVKAESIEKSNIRSNSNKSEEKPKVKQNNLVGNLVKSKQTQSKSTQRQSKSSSQSQDKKLIQSFENKIEKVKNQIKKQVIKVQQYHEEQEQKKPFQFHMQQEYEMQFQDCQPELNIDNDQYSSDDQDFQNNQSKVFVQRNIHTPSFANVEDHKDHKLAFQVKQIQNLVNQMNQAVKDAEGTNNVEEAKKQKKQNIIKVQKTNNSQKQEHIQKKEEIIKQEVKQQIKQKQENQQKNVFIDQSKSTKPIEKPLIIQQKVKQKVLVQQEPVLIKQQTKQQYMQKKETLKQQIKSKNDHINSLRNQLSNINFQLSDTQGQEEQIKGNYSVFKKKQFNPQHVKINDKINQLKQSAMTILGEKKYSTFYEYLKNMTEKNKSVKRDTLQHMLSRDKIGAFHLVQQIVRLNRVIQKVPKFLD